MSAPLLSLGAQSCVREAAEWRLVALLLERPREGWHAEVSALAREVEDPALRSTAEAARDASEGHYLAFLGNGGPVSPREVGHRGASDPGHLLAQLGRLYTSFAFRPRTEDPIDHVAVEADFLGYVRLKQAYAAQHGDERAASEVVRAADTMVREHLAFLAEPLCLGLERHGGGYLTLAARALLERIGPPPAGWEGGWTPRGLESEDACGPCHLSQEP